MAVPGFERARKALRHAAHELAVAPRLDAWGRAIVALAAIPPALFIGHMLSKILGMALRPMCVGPEPWAAAVGMGLSLAYFSYLGAKTIGQMCAQHAASSGFAQRAAEREEAWLARDEAEELSRGVPPAPRARKCSGRL